MVERVARALYAIRMELAEGANLPQYTWETERNPYREHCLREARAAIEAMREPTPEMVRTTVDFMFTVSLGGNYRWTDYARDVHCCMIDAALTSHTDTPKPQPQTEPHNPDRS